MSSKHCSDQIIIDAANSSTSMSQAAAKCGLHFSTFKRRALKLNVYKTNQGSKDAKKDWQVKIDLNEILEGKHPSYQTYKLRNRLIKNGILEYKCSVCKIHEYNDLPLTLELDHINGVRTDHRLCNLRLLCPNCHSQTNTWRGKNIKNAYTNDTNLI